MLNYKKNNRGQVGDTISWIVATVIVVVILFVFVFAASLLSGKKNLTTSRNAIFSEESFFTGDLILTKSLYVYSSVSDSNIKDEIKNKLKEWENEKENPSDIDKTISNLQ